MLMLIDVSCFSLSNDFFTKGFTALRLYELLKGYRVMIKEYLYYLASNKRYSENTIRRYEIVLHQFAGAMKGFTWSTIDKDMIEQYISGLALSSSSCANVVSILRSFFGWMCHHYGLTDNPCRYVVSPKIKSIIPHPISMDVIGRAVRHCSSISIQVAIMLMARCGLRVSEVLSLSLDRIKNGTALIVGKGNKERYVFIPDYIINRIQAICKRGLIFAKWDDRGFRKAIWMAFRNVGEYVSPHQLRHTFATWAINNGMPINQLAMLLGHDDIRTTQRYLLSDNDVVRTSYNRIFL